MNKNSESKRVRIQETSTQIQKQDQDQDQLKYSRSNINQYRDFCLNYLLTNSQELPQIKLKQKLFVNPTLAEVQDIFTLWGGKPGLNGNNINIQIKKIVSFQVIHDFFNVENKLDLYESIRHICDLQRYQEIYFGNYMEID